MTNAKKVEIQMQPNFTTTFKWQSFSFFFFFTFLLFTFYTTTSNQNNNLATSRIRAKNVCWSEPGKYAKGENKKRSVHLTHASFFHAELRNHRF